MTKNSKTHNIKHLIKFAVEIVLLVALICIILITINNNPEEQDSSRFYLDSSEYAKSEIVELDAAQYQELIDDQKSFVLIARNETCPVEAPLSTTVEQFQNDHNLNIYSLKADKYKETGLSKGIPYLPTAIIYQNGEVVSYLRADSDEDLQYYKTPESFQNWLEQYIYLEEAE